MKILTLFQISFCVLLAACSAPQPGPAPLPSVSPVIEYWTGGRMAEAHRNGGPTPPLYWEADPVSKPDEPSEPTIVPNSSLGTMPYAATGNIYLEFAGRVTNCSGSLINGKDGNKYLLTAAHCIFSPVQRVWASKIMLCTQGRPPDQCTNQYSVKAISIIKRAQRYTKYYFQKSVAEYPYYDQAVLELDQAATEPALDVVFPTQIDTQVISLGYPSGQSMYEFTGEIRTLPGIVYLPNDSMQEGASGGPWVLDDELSNLMGVNSGYDVLPTVSGMVSALFSQNQRDLIDCATSGDGCAAAPPTGDGRLDLLSANPRIANSVSRPPQAAYLQDGYIAALAYGVPGEACDTSAAGLYLYVFQLNPAGELASQSCRSVGPSQGYHSYSLTVLKDPRSQYYREVIVVATQTSSGAALLASYVVSDDSGNPQIQLAASLKLPFLANNLVVRQVQPGFFALMTVRNRRLVVEYLSVNFKTGEIASLGPQSNYFGVNTDAFHAATLASYPALDPGKSVKDQPELGPQWLVAATPTTYLESDVELRVFQADYSASWKAMHTKKIATLKTGILLPPASGDHPRARVLQMDSGIIVIGYVAETKEIMLGTYAYIPERKEIRMLQPPSGVGQQGLSVDFADMGNGFLVLAIGDEEGEGPPAYLSMRITQCGEGLSAWSATGPTKATNLAVAPLFFGWSAVHQLKGDALTAVVTANPNGNLYVNALRVRGAAAIRPATFSTESLWSESCRGAP